MSTSLLVKEDQRLIWLKILTALAIALGLYARFKGLGTASFIDDEYYLAKSVQNVLATGFPEFASGGYYTRGLIQQYISAAILLLPVDLEWGMRIFPLLCNLMCIPAVYLLTLTASGSRATAYASIILFVLSVWETEFSRFARMYAPLQLVFLWYVYYWLKAVIDGNSRAACIAAVLAGFGLLVHAASIVMLALCVIPFFLSTRLRLDRSLFIIGLGVLFFLFSRYGFDFPIPVPPSDLSSESSAATSITALIPNTIASQIVGAPVWLFGYLVLLGLAGWLVIKTWRIDFDTVLVKCLLLSSIALLVANLLTLSAIIVFLALLIDTRAEKLTRDAMKQYGYMYIGLLFSAVAFFGAFLLSTDQWLNVIAPLDGSRFSGKAIQGMALLFNFPEIAQRYVKPFLLATPFTFTFFAAASAVGVLIALSGKVRVPEAFRYLVFIFVLCALFVGITGSFQKTTRYSFFFYPLLIILAIASIEFVKTLLVKNARVSSALNVVLVLGLIVSLDDYSFDHLLTIDSEETRLRTTLSKDEKEHYLARRDFLSPVEYINKNMMAGDLVVSATTPTDIYLNKPLDYMYIPHTTHRFWERNVGPGGLDVWSDAKMLYRDTTLFQLVESCTAPIWLLMFAVDWSGAPQLTFRERYGDFLKYTSIDKTLDVFYIHSCSN